MPSIQRVERALRAELSIATGEDTPPGLADALLLAVFPGGARIRPLLCLAAAEACGDPHPALSDAVAAALELVHCASLVHDDLPCFDDAETRRGRPSVHRAMGEPLAVLAGDALIVMAFEALGRAGAAAPDRLPQLIGVLGRAVSCPHGIIAGQAWESERRIPMVAYRRAKTAALFEAAVVAGALAAGRDGEALRLFGQKVGEAYQVADDIHDVTGDPLVLGKPVGRDASLGRPNAANELGVRSSRHLVERLLEQALAAIPSWAERDPLEAWMHEVARQMRKAGQPRALEPIAALP